ncbi:hypothetical protein PV325_005256 [Microctonus aethiopoides]|nr:hypothetical protein PV325_005256 [Microctonus aethiopoides]
MTNKRVWGFFMDFIIFLLILQACSLVQTIEVQTGQIKDEKLIEKASAINVTANVSDTIKFDLSSEPEFRIIVENFNHEDILPELYDEVLWMKRFSTEKDEITPTPIIGQLGTDAEKGLDILKIPDENNHFNRNMLRIENESLTNFMNLIPSVPESDEKNISTIKYNSTTLKNALYHTLLSNAWTHYLEPLLHIAAAKSTSNSLNITKNAARKNFDHIKIGQRQDKLPIMFHNQTNNSTTIALKTLLEAHIRLSTNNTSTSNKSNDSINSTSSDLPIAQSMHSRIQNASGNIKDIIITNDPNPPKIRITITNKSQPTNDSLIFEIDTTASSSMEAMITPQTQKSNPVQNIKNGAARSLIQISKNNTNNDNFGSINITTPLQDNNNSKIRPPYSARYSRIHKPALNDRKIQKREIAFNSDYNAAQRQELASYFYNEQKIRENYPTYAKLTVDDGNFPLNIYNTDGINEGTGIDVYPFQALYARNLDFSPPEETFDETLNLNSNMTQNFHTDINDSSLLYLADKLGYSIIDDTVMTSTTTEIITENETIYSKMKSPTISNITEKKQKKNSAGKNSASKRNGHKSKSKSKKNRKSKTRKNKKNGRKSSVKSTKRRNNKKSKSNTSKYSKNQTNHKNKSNTQNVLKKKRKASTTRSNSRDES